MEGFRSFDWDGDARWQAFSRNLEVPNPRLLEKAKAKWYSREIDPAFDATSIGNGAASASRPAAAAAPAPEPSVTEPSGGAANESGPSAAPRPQVFTGGGFGARLQAVLRQGGGLERVLFVQHLLLIALFILYLQPLIRTLSRASYGQFQLVAVISYFMKVGLRFGAPRLKPFPAALKSWFVQAAATTDLQYAIICGAFAGARPMLLVCIPTVVLAVYHAFAYASAHFGDTALWQRYGQPAHARLAAKQRDAQLYNAGAEVGLGFLTLLNLFTRDRNFMLAILYWQILRTRYHTPDCAAYHRQVWGMLAQTARPVLDSVPMLRTPIGLAQRWFTNVR